MGDRNRCGRLRRATIVMIAAVAVAGLAGCSQKGRTMTPHESRDQLIKIVHDTQKQLDAGPWRLSQGAYAQACTLADGSTGVWYTYATAASPRPDHLGDAKRVAQYWTSLGMTVRLVPTPDPVVYGTGGPATGVMFSTAPGDYAIGGSSTCVIGNADELNGAELGG